MENIILDLLQMNMMKQTCKNFQQKKSACQVSQVFSCPLSITLQVI